MYIDTGANVSCVGEWIWKRIGSPDLSQTKDLRGYTNGNIKTLGKTIITATIGNKKLMLHFTSQR